MPSLWILGALIVAVVFAGFPLLLGGAFTGIGLIPRGGPIPMWQAFALVYGCIVGVCGFVWLLDLLDRVWARRKDRA